MTFLWIQPELYETAVKLKTENNPTIAPLNSENN